MGAGGVYRDNLPGEGALSGTRVLELCQLIAGPFCAQLLADMGADVIKAEPPGTGDPMRVWGRSGFPLLWTVLARGKRCITLNLREPDGQAMVRRLVAECDILVENFRPGTMEKWGLGYDVLSQINPRLIMVRVSGYGQTGPYADRPGYASVGEAMGGMRYMMGEPDRKPSRAGLSLGDTLAGTFAAMGALAALRHRDVSGQGQVVDASIFESVLAMTESLVPEYQVEGRVRERSGSRLDGIAPSNIYEGSDGMVIIAANQDTVFSRLASAIGQPGLAQDTRFSTHSARGVHQDVLDDLIGMWTRGRTVGEIEAIMIEHGVPVGRVFTAKEMLQDPHFSDREALIDVETERFGPVSMPAPVPKLSVSPGRVRWAGPDKLGAHTQEVLSEILGLGADEIEALRARGII